jgi:hypothetical protein
VNFWGGGTWNLQNYRSYAAFPVFGGADGTNPWDVNDPTVYFTGTAAQNSSGTTVTVSGNPNWTTNRWVGYVVRRTTNLCNVTNANTFGLIVGNTSNTLTWIPNAFTGLGALSFVQETAWKSAKSYGPWICRDVREEACSQIRSIHQCREAGTIKSLSRFMRGTMDRCTLSLTSRTYTRANISLTGHRCRVTRLTFTLTR